MGQKNKLCSSSIEWITMWSPSIHAEDGMEKCVEGRGGTKLSP